MGLGLKAVAVHVNMDAQYREINAFNTCFVRDPYKYVPLQLCPRDEIMDPRKIRAACEVAPHEWGDFNAFGMAFRCARIPWHRRYRAITNVELECVYVLAENTEMFATAAKVNGDDAHAIYNWLCQWADTIFVITCPVMYYEGLMGRMYSTNYNTYHLLLADVDPLSQLMSATAGCYSVGGAVILAIAMCRLGLWNTRAVRVALGSFRRVHTLLPPINTNNMLLWAVHPMPPHVCDVPSLYAASIPLFDSLRLNADEGQDEHMEHYVLQYGNPRITYTSLAAATFPHFTPAHGRQWPLTFESTTDHEPDWIGMILSVVNRSNRAAWRWWRSRSEDLIRRGNAIKTFDTIMTCLFCIYERGHDDVDVVKSRVRAIWNDMMRYSGANMARWGTKILLQYHLYTCVSTYPRVYVFGSPKLRTWKPDMPIAFFKDLMAFIGDDMPLFTKRVYLALVNDVSLASPLTPLLTRYRMLDQPSESGFHIELIFECSLWNLLTHTHAHIARALEKKIASRLCALQTAFMQPTPRCLMGHGGGPIIWTVMQQYLQTHRNALVF